MSDFHCAGVSVAPEAPVVLPAPPLVPALLDEPPHPAMARTPTASASAGLTRANLIGMYSLLSSTSPSSAEQPGRAAETPSLLQEPGETPVLEDSSLRLTRRAIGHNVILIEHRLELVTAPRAGLALVPVHGEGHRQLVRDRQAECLVVMLERPGQAADHGLTKSPRLIGIELGSPLERG